MEVPWPVFYLKEHLRVNELAITSFGKWLYTGNHVIISELTGISEQKWRHRHSNIVSVYCWRAIYEDVA